MFDGRECMDSSRAAVEAGRGTAAAAAAAAVVIGRCILCQSEHDKYSGRQSSCSDQIASNVSKVLLIRLLLCVPRPDHLHCVPSPCPSLLSLPK